VGLSKATISRIERGIQPYTQDTLQGIAEALECSAVQLTTRARFRVPAVSRRAGEQ
jgi:transcriptional regulator with XRE-family HTH domain